MSAQLITHITPVMIQNGIVAFNITTSSSASTNITTPSTATTSSRWGTGTVASGLANALYSVQDQDDFYNLPIVRDCTRLMGQCSVADGEKATIKLPDGTVIDIERDGSFVLNDKDAKIIYRANRLREFNKFINVSDRLEEFIAFCGQHGVRQGEMLDLPVRLFIGWLAIEAAKADKEPEPDIKLLPDLRKCQTPRCVNCGKFILREMPAMKIEFCAPKCFDDYYISVLVANDRSGHGRPALQRPA
ncbi:MAG: hypothetical protein Q7N50_10790 [Armatimonadota bacterium]|nr:hypothetical protein [Armatimonadota bacterium]